MLLSIVRRNNNMKARCILTYKEKQVFESVLVCYPQL